MTYTFTFGDYMVLAYQLLNGWHITIYRNNTRVDWFRDHGALLGLMRHALTIIEYHRTNTGS